MLKWIFNFKKIWSKHPDNVVLGIIFLIAIIYEQGFKQIMLYTLAIVMLFTFGLSLTHTLNYFFREISFDRKSIYCFMGCIFSTGYFVSISNFEVIKVTYVMVSVLVVGLFSYFWYNDK